MMEQLPIYDIIGALKGQLTAQNRCILQAPPGAGKSTVVPLELMHEPWLKGKKILMLEPRRLATRAVAQRMAQTLNEPIGKTVGYRMRFEHKVSELTRVEVVTEGMLTRMIQDDNALEAVGMIIFDEFHERSLHADLGLVLSLQVQEVLREDLRLLIMSATLDTKSLAQLLNTESISSQGRQYPIDTHYLPFPDHLSIAAKMHKGIKQALREEKGDILCFLPGAGDIRKCHELLDLDDLDAQIRPLYGALSPKDQDLAIQPDDAGRRKIVLATSLAETSLTIQGIRVVIDSGHSRAPQFDPRSGLSRLETIEVTRDAADQRRGRAGRLGPGVCYRIWEERRHQYLQAHRKPEILSADLAPLVLELANWGVSDLSELKWPTLPPEKAVEQARAILESLDALEDGKITETGKDLLSLPTHPRYGHLLRQAEKMGCSALGSDIVALLEEPIRRPDKGGVDIWHPMKLLMLFRKNGKVGNLSGKLKRIEKLSAFWRRKFKTDALEHLSDSHLSGQLISFAYPERIAKLIDKEHLIYKTANHKRVKLDPSDPLQSVEWIAIAHMDPGREEGKVFLAAPLNIEDLAERFEERVVMKWDHQSDAFSAKEEVVIGGLRISSKEIKEVPTAQKAHAICEAIRSKPELLNWESASFLIPRVKSLSIWNPEEEWPDFSQKTLLGNLDDWLFPYLNAIRRGQDLKKIDLQQALLALLPWPKPNEIKQLCPEKIEVPSGSKIKLQYFEDGRPPVLAVRLQELFGQLETPRINQGKTAVMVHLLSPAQRPIQVTQDLRNFWENTYAEVRKDLRGRYSKHYWPEDPFSAEAIRGVRPKKK